MPRKLFLLAALALFTWPVAVATADDEDDDEILRDLDRRVTGLEERVTDLENEPDADTLGELSCSDGEIAKFDGTVWVCAADEVGRDTLGELSCADGEIARFDAATSQWVCAAPSGGADLLRTIVISPLGPTAVDNCDQLRAALDGIADNGPDNPYLIKLEPGVYDCGPDSVVMKPHVDIEGSGVNATRITGNPNTVINAVAAGGVIVGTDNAELRQLTAEHRGGTDFAIVIDNLGSAMRVSNVDVTISSPASNTTFGIAAFDASPGPILRDVRVIISGPNAFNSIAIAAGARFGFFGEANLENVTASGGTGLLGNGAGRVLARDSVLAGSTAVASFGTIIGVVSTQVSGPVSAGAGGELRCTAAYDIDFFPLDANCGGAP